MNACLVTSAHIKAVPGYHVLKNRTPDRELGGDHVPADQPERRAKKLVRRLKALGFDLQPFSGARLCPTRARRGNPCEPHFHGHSH